MPIILAVISVYSIEGRLIEQQLELNTQKQISISTALLKESYYVVKIQSDKGISTKSFIVKH
jgi:hypothetical protein